MYQEPDGEQDVLECGGYHLMTNTRATKKTLTSSRAVVAVQLYLSSQV